MKDYIIISHSETIEVEKDVRKLLNEGWKLVGGISTSYKHEHAATSEHKHIPGHLVFSQAMIKE